MYIVTILDTIRYDLQKSDRSRSPIMHLIFACDATVSFFRIQQAAAPTDPYIIPRKKRSNPAAAHVSRYALMGREEPLVCAGLYQYATIFDTDVLIRELFLLINYVRL